MKPKEHLYIQAASANRAHTVHTHEKHGAADISDAREDWSYPVFALRNPKEQLVRIYGQFLPSVIGNDTNRGEQSQVAGCAMTGGGREEVVPLTREVEELMRYDDNFTATIMHVANYIIDCHDPGNWATEVTIQLQNGTASGRTLTIINMEGEHRGRLGVCSQPLHTDRAWLHDWVLHYFGIGASNVIMHMPKGPQIDDLFNEHRQERLEFNSHLAERSAFHTGTMPVQRFERDNLVWREYWPSPTAMYYAEELVFTACHYSMRYSHTYTIQFDVDEFWMAGEETHEKRLSDFLDKYMLEDAAAMGFLQVLYPLDCPTRADGPYAGRFTLRAGQGTQVKPAVRPAAVRRMHVHGLLDTSQEWKEKHGWDQKYWESPIEMAFLKHIRPSTRIDEKDGSVHHYKCQFGEELDPEHHGLQASI